MSLLIYFRSYILFLCQFINAFIFFELKTRRSDLAGPHTIKSSTFDSLVPASLPASHFCSFTSGVSPHPIISKQLPANQKIIFLVANIMRMSTRPLRLSLFLDLLWFQTSCCLGHFQFFAHQKKVQTSGNVSLNSHALQVQSSDEWEYHSPPYSISRQVMTFPPPLFPHPVLTQSGNKLKHPCLPLLILRKEEMLPSTCTFNLSKVGILPSSHTLIQS